MLGSSLDSMHKIYGLSQNSWSFGIEIKMIEEDDFTLQVLNVFENRMSTSSLKRFGSLLTHWGNVDELAFGMVL